MTDKRGQVHEIEVTVYGGKLIVVIDGRTKIPLVGKVGPINEHEVLSMRALVTQVRTNVAGHARLHKVVFDRGFWDGVELWWLDQHGMTFVVPAKDHMAVTADARAPAAAGEGITGGRRVHTIHYYGIFPIAEYSLLLGVNIKDRPPGIGTRQQILAKYRLTAAG